MMSERVARRGRAWLTLALGVLVALWSGGCTEPVEDIDRTQGNLLRKADLEGEWYLLQTVVGVPPTSGFTFVGETSKMERVRWVIQKDQIVAYRAYPLVPGADSPTAGVEFDGTDNPVAAYPIIDHVDVLREYNAQSGEQSNVISENTSDRLWHEREFVRVDWSASLVSNFDFIAPVRTQVSVASFIPFEQGGPDAMHLELVDGKLDAFDVTGQLFVEPDEWGCIFSWIGWSAEDCSSAEIKVRTSYARVKPSTYHPFHYDDRLMSRFGYFRTEFFTYDEQRGVVDSGRRLLINRHHIFERSVDEAGVPIPLPERSIKTVPYYLSPDFPDDPALRDAAEVTMNQWNSAAKKGLAAAFAGKPGGSGLAPGDTLGTGLTDVFVLCSNPVAEGDPEACGAVGFAPRVGDLRYSTLHWVDSETLVGLLGYGPAAVDPTTGETISGRAYVYGAPVSRWASHAVDVIRYFNGELDLETVAVGGQFTPEVIERLRNRPSEPGPASERLARTPIDRHLHKHGRPARPRVDPGRRVAFDAQRLEARIDTARSAGQGPSLLNPEMKRAVAASAGVADFDALPAAAQAALDPARVFNPMALKRHMKQRKTAMARSADLADMLQPDLEGIVLKYAGRTDYDAVFKEIRAEIFAAVAEHEVGHALGLRHNFQGSFDSINYPDHYWNLRQENLIPIETLGDLYRSSTQTEAQIAGLMRQNQYSSIMDYGFGWANDLAGIGKYDEAALVFGYTADAYAATGDRCTRYPSVSTGAGCVADLPGYVPVFKKTLDQLGDAAALLDRREEGFTLDDSGLPSISVLERFHYTTVAQAFPALSDLSEAGREYAAYADYVDRKGDADRLVRVPFMFCSDEWETGLMSCSAWDQGADPFELARSKIEDYRANYVFVNFRRDRTWFDIWDPLFDYFFRNFLPLSDLFQHWYVAPYGIDPVLDRSYDLAINSAFSLLGEVVATPPYGEYCEGDDGRLVLLSEEPRLQGEIIDPDCADGGRRVFIEPGVGRRRFSRFDADVGYSYEYKPQEAGHYWASLAAVWALTDPEAYLIGVEGDAGTYAISFYDWFGDELEALVGNVLAENYAAFAPRGAPVMREGRLTTGLKYVPAAPLYDPDTGAFYDAETGTEVDPDPAAGPLAGATGLCSPCDADRDCAGHTGFLEGTFCQPLDDGTTVCLQDCFEDASLCPAGTACDERGNCVPGPEVADCAPLRGACSAANPLGDCDRDETCVEGACVSYPWAPVIETNPTFGLATDFLFYGFLFTTASYSTRFNDQLNVFRPGTANAVEADPVASETQTFTDPTSGVTYAAVQPRCGTAADGLPAEAVTGGSGGLCSPCAADAECAGHTGDFGGIYCQPLEAGGDGYCLQDCSEDASLCAEGDTCDEFGNCIPDGGVCFEPEPCSPAAPLGFCDEGSTCVAGACAETFSPSAHCTYLRPGDTSAVQLVKRGRTLAANYEASLTEWYSYDGANAALDERLARRYYLDQFRLRSHVDLLETIQATYAIFGRVY